MRDTKPISDKLAGLMAEMEAEREEFDCKIDGNSYKQHFMWQMTSWELMRAERLHRETCEKHTEVYNQIITELEKAISRIKPLEGFLINSPIVNPTPEIKKHLQAIEKTNEEAQQ